MCTLGLVHLKTHLLAMHRLFLILKDCTNPTTDDELPITSGKKPLDAETANTYLVQVETGSENLLSMFVKQPQQNAISNTLSITFLN